MFIQRKQNYEPQPKNLPVEQNIGENFNLKKLVTQVSKEELIIIKSMLIDRIQEIESVISQVWNETKRIIKLIEKSAIDAVMEINKLTENYYDFINLSSVFTFQKEEIEKNLNTKFVYERVNLQLDQNIIASYKNLNRIITEKKTLHENEKLINYSNIILYKEEAIKKGEGYKFSSYNAFEKQIGTNIYG